VNHQVTPVQKVIQLLEDMVAKGTSEKQAEEAQFAAYTQFCQITTKAKKDAIKKASEMIESLQADIQKYEAEADTMAKEIGVLDVDITTWEGDGDSSQRVRDIELKDYDRTRAEFTASIDALNEAEATLKAQAGDVGQEMPMPEMPGEGAFAQIQKSKLIPTQAKRAITAFFQMPSRDAGDESSDLRVVAPEAFLQQDPKGIANAYESQSDGVIEMVAKLQEKFHKKRDDLDAENAASVRAFQKLKADLKNNLDFARSSRDEKKTAKSKILQEAADAKGDLSDTETTRESDVKFLADLTATCEQKASAYEQRQKLRAQELVAVNEAIGIMAGGAVKGGSEKHLPQLLQIQTKRAAALVQLRAQPKTPVQHQVAAYLKSRGQKLNSHLLSVLAERIAVDPFKKVKKMVKDLIVKLMEEAQAETEQKGWCDMELATNEKTRKKKTKDVEELHAQVDELEASIAVLTEDVERVSKQISELDAAMAEAIKLRSEEKAKNEVTITDAKAGQAAVANAIGVLKDFYDEAAKATAFTQTTTKARIGTKQPEIFEGAYTGMGGENGGVIGMMEVIQADFERLESETKNSESEAQAEYDEFMHDSKMDKAQKEKDFDHWSASKQNQAQALVETKDTLAGTQDELDAAEAYYNKLKPQCIAEENAPSYEEKVARRKEEIESLKEALRILQGEEVI